MKCDRCDRPAIVHQVIISNGTHREIHLCEVHAAEAGIPVPGKQPVNQLLGKAAAATAAGVVPACPACGTTLTQIRKSSKFGCPSCYDAFGQATEVIVKSAQGGAEQHVGRAPGGLTSQETRKHESRRLVQELDQAVRSEQYERAAKIKQRLTQLAEEAKHPPEASQDTPGT